MKILLVYPEFSMTFWSLRPLLKFIGKKATFTPLGLLTVAAMLPKLWEKKLVDVNVRKLTDEDIRWADYVFISAMAEQEKSAKEVIMRCNSLGIPVVLGGPILEIGCEEFPGVKHFFLGEAENTLQEFVEDLQSGKAKKSYESVGFPDLAACPIPMWELVNLKDYANILVQYGRGCPFACTFCNIAEINGRTPRTKSPGQFLHELDAIYNAGFRGPIMLADDNFIGSKKAVKEMLPQLAAWQKEHGYPFDVTAEVDITLADDNDLMDLMVAAGFKKIFLGLETPNKESLVECHKVQNLKRDMAGYVKKIQNRGLIPMSGFIVGFDSDNPETFAKQMISFIQETGIVIAMVGVLKAYPKTALTTKLKQQGRILTNISGQNTDCCPNFVPKMPLPTLVAGYKEIVATIYSPKEYYKRISVLLREYSAAKRARKKVTATDFKAFVASLWRIGLFGGLKTSYYYWKTLLLAFFKYRRAFSEAVALQVYGMHFRKVARGIQKS